MPKATLRSRLSGLSGLKEFLPRHALVMARRVNTPRPTPALAILIAAMSLEEGQLLDRMLEAVGLTRAKVLLIEFGAESSPKPDELAERLSGARVVLMLGQAAPSVSPDALSSFKLFQTHSLSRLLLEPALKKEAWAELLSVARELGLEIRSKGGRS